MSDSTPISEKPSAGGRIVGLDAMRMIALVAIVHAHAPQFGMPSIVFDQSMGWVVAFFFMVSGFFLAKSKEAAWPLIKRLTVRIGIPFAFWFVLYNVWREAYFLKHATPAEAFSPEHLQYLFQGGYGFHLWFLPSLWMSSVILVLLRRFPFFVMLAAGLAFYAAGLVYGSYSAPLLHETPLWNTRNGPFFGMVFLVAGYGLARFRLEPPLWVAICLFAAGYASHMGEYFWLDRHHDLARADYFIGTLPLTIGGFLIASRLGGAPGAVFLGAVGRYGLGIYCAHLFLLRATLAIVPPQSTWQSLAIALVVLAVTSALVMLAARVRLARWVLV